MSPNSLLKQARAGSTSSLGQLLQVYSACLLVLAENELGSDLRVKASASDLVQESFLEAKRDFATFRGGSAAEFQAWLRKLLLNNIANLARDYRNTIKRDIAREVTLQHGRGPNATALHYHEPSASSLVIKNEMLDSLHCAIARLPPDYQVVIQLRNYERATFEQIGSRLGRSAEAARKLWTRALEVLEKEIEFPSTYGKCGT